MKRILTTLAIVCSLFALTGCGVKKIDVQDMVTLKMSGLNTMGAAEAKINESALESAIFAADDSSSNIAIVLSSNIFATVTPNDNLSNGDVVQIEVGYDESVWESKGFALENASFSYTISGLEEGKSVDVESLYEITYEGATPTIVARINNISAEPDLANVSFIANSPILNGEPFEIIAQFDGSSYTVDIEKSHEKALSMGYLVSEEDLRITITPENLPYHVYHKEDVHPDILTLIYDEVAPLIQKNVENAYYRIFYSDDLEGFRGLESMGVDSITPHQIYLAKLATESTVPEYSHVNALFIIYEVNAVDTKYPEGQKTYVPVSYFNLWADGDDVIQFDYNNLAYRTTANWNTENCHETPEDAIEWIKTYYDYKVNELEWELIN